MRWRRGAVRKAELQTVFDGLDDWLRERLVRYDGIPDLVRQVWTGVQRGSR